MNIFLAGATGVIGRPLLARVLDEGHAVTTITRSEAGAEPLRAQGVKVVVTDVFDRAKVRQAVIEARPEVVVHQLTRIPHSIDPRRVAEQFVQTNRLRTEGTEILMEAALAAGAGQFIAQGITLFYAPDRPGLATEDEPLYLSAPSSFAPVVKALDRLEQIVLNTPGITGAVMRYGHLYGPGTAYAADGSVADLVRQRKMPIVGRGDAVFSFTHVEDAAGATLRAMKQAVAGAFNIVDDDPAPLHTWLPVYADLLGAPQPMRVPKLIGQLVAGRFGMFYTNEQRGASNQKARQQLGWQPQYASWRDGFRLEISKALEPSLP